MMVLGCVLLPPHLACAQTPTPAKAPAVDSKSTEPSNQQTLSGFERLSNRPIILSAEAHAGRPYGIGKITYRLAESDEVIARTGAVLLTEANQRVSFPVISKTPLRKFLANFIRNRRDETRDSKTFWFLFTGDEPLTASVHSSGVETLQIPVTFDQPRQYQREKLVAVIRRY